MRNTIEHRHGTETVDAAILADSRNRQPLSEAATEIAFLIVQRAIAERNMARMAEMSGVEAAGLGHAVSRHR